MALLGGNVYAVSITKDIPWRGRREKFSNVYHYRTEFGEPFADNAVIDKVTAAEKAIFGTAVAFLEGRTWGPTNQGREASLMREIKSLSGTGAAPTTASMYPELAILLSWPLGRYGRKNRPQFLRKWCHTFSVHAYDLAGSSPMTNVPAALTNYMANVRDVDPGVPGFNVYPLCTKGGRGTEGAGRAYPYMEHRQFGRKKKKKVL